MGVKFLQPGELAEMLVETLVGGFDVERVSRAAFNIYRRNGLRLTPEMDRIILILMTMSEGPEFELSEAEFLKVIEEVRTM